MLNDLGMFPLLNSNLYTDLKFLFSELNFPIGDKFDLDGSSDGERWSLPIHLLDAIFYHSTSRVRACGCIIYSGCGVVYCNDFI